MKMMKHTLFTATLLLMLGAACTACSEDEPALPRTELSASGAILSGRAGSEFTVTLNSENGWSATAAGEGFSFEPASGGAGESTLTIRAAADNTADSERTLGELLIREPDGARQTIAVVQAPRVAEQSLFFIMTGTGLSSYFTQNIREATEGYGEAGSTRGRVLVLQQNSSSSVLAEVRYNPVDRNARLIPLREYAGLCTTDPDDLTMVLNEMVEEAPARHYGLIMGSHATAWVPSNYTNISHAPRVGGAAGNEAAYWTAYGEPTRWYGYDRQQAMDIPTLAACIEAAGVTFEYLIFDACFMSSIETLYDLRHAATHIVASPCEIMARGYPYRTLMAALFDADVHHDLQAACQAFYDFYATTSATRRSGCTALAVCDRLDALADVAARIGQSKLKACDPASLQSYEGLSPHLFFDFRQYIEAICDDPALLAEFETAFEAAFPAECRLHTPSFYSTYTPTGAMLDIDYYSGVTISEPSSKYTLENRQTAWYRATHR